MSVQFIGLIAFSHLLSPRDIGLIAMLMVFVSLGDIVRDFGLTQAAVQTRNLTPGQASNLFWTNTFIGLAMTSGLILAAPVVARIYSEPVLIDIAPWIALTLLFNGAQAQFQVRLIRDFRFTALAMTDIASQLIGLVAGLAAALSGLTYWALVIQVQCICGSLLVQRALIAGWWPRRPRREKGMAALYRFGLHSGLAQLLGFAAFNADSYIVGVRWGASSLGIYQRAYQLYSVPLNAFVAPLTSVVLPFLSKLRHDTGDFYPLLWKAQVVISTFTTFVFMLVGSLSEPVVRLALGPAWTASAQILSILSIGGAIQVLNYIANWAFLASGNAKQLFLNGLFNKPLLILFIALGSLQGLEGVAWGFTAGIAISWVTSLVWLRFCDAMPLSRFLMSGFRVFASGLISGGMVWSFVRYAEGSVPVGLLIVGGLALSVVLYAPLIMVNKVTRSLLIDTARPAFASMRRIFRNGQPGF